MNQGLALARTLTVAACLAASQASANLVANGDFEAGNTGFTSNYSFSPGGNSTEGQYTVRSDPGGWNGFFVNPSSHTPGGSLMMVINGNTVSGQFVWRSQSITVLPNTGYFFDAYATSVCCIAGYGGLNSPPNLEFFVEGDVSSVSLGTILVDVSSPGTWQGFSKAWNSGANTQVVLSLLNRNTTAGGNDFALDDISFDTTSTVVIPLPAGLPLLLSGLAAFGLLRRRARA